MVFQVTQPFSPMLNEFSVWFPNDKPTVSPDACYHSPKVFPGKITADFFARCENGWARVSVVGGLISQETLYNQFGVESEIPEAYCQDYVLLPEFNPQQTCYWEFRVPCCVDDASNSVVPSKGPTAVPSVSVAPTSNPSKEPTVSAQPSELPSVLPTAVPSRGPTAVPSVSVAPTSNPSEGPTASVQPSSLPSGLPTASSAPSSVPSDGQHDDPRDHCEVTEKSFASTCSQGQFGASNIEIIWSDGEIVVFQVTQPFSPVLNKFSVWFPNDKPTVSPDTCYYSPKVFPGNVAVDFFAKCDNGSARISIVGGLVPEETLYNQLGVETEVPEAFCQDYVLLPDFNPQKSCYWEFRVPCCDETTRSLKALRDEEVTEVEVGTTDSCVEQSKRFDVHPVVVDQCTTAKTVPNVADPISIDSQDEETVSFSINQSWQGTIGNEEGILAVNNTISWLAVDYESPVGDLRCHEFVNVPPGKFFTSTAKCTNGWSVVDLYARQKKLFRQQNDSSVLVPAACDAAMDGANMCHFRYMLRCSPSRCHRHNQHTTVVPSSPQSSEVTTTSVRGALARIWLNHLKPLFMGW